MEWDLRVPSSRASARPSFRGLDDAGLSIVVAVSSDVALICDEDEMLEICDVEMIFLFVPLGIGANECTLDMKRKGR